MRRAQAAGGSYRRCAIQGFVVVFLVYVLSVLVLEVPLVYRETLWAAVVKLRRGSRLLRIVSDLDLRHLNATRSGSLRKVAAEAAGAGARVFSDLQTFTGTLTELDASWEERSKCPHSIVLSGDKFRERGRTVELPCGLTLGSYITVAATPHVAHVDGMAKCEKWIRDDEEQSEQSNTSWWLNRLIGRTKVSVDWPYPFVEGRLFVLTLTAGLEGYHVNVDGRHVTSFSYRTGFVLEDATGLSLSGDLDVQSKHLEMLPIYQAPPLPDEPVEIFIGILSAGNHFAERMAVRKTWMSAAQKPSNINGRKEVNAELKKEAEFFGDIVIVPFIDSYDLVVLKTVAICEYGVRVVSARYIMKCDDDNFVRLDSVIAEVKKIPRGKSLYMGNMNYHHKPLRNGKWAVTYEEWPEEDYPTYANGPGYVISSDIADSIVSEFVYHKLRLFKMEDVSMGMWVARFNNTRHVKYVHSVKFCQFGCIDDYYTAHYQSPRQMLCLWDKLQAGKAQCCNLR
ncbi:hypothetical protein ABZP36_018031 [Zizania latifolia]